METYQPGKQKQQQQKFPGKISIFREFPSGTNRKTAYHLPLNRSFAVFLIFLSIHVCKVNEVFSF